MDADASFAADVARRRKSHVAALAVVVRDVETTCILPHENDTRRVGSYLDNSIDDS